MADPPQPPQQQPKKSIFGKDDASPNIMQDIAGQVNNLSRTVRTLEDRFTTMHKKDEVIEQNMISNDKKFVTDIKLINSELLDIKTEINDIKEKLMLLVKELKLSATKEEVGVVQKYLGYWEPLNFVTRNELDKALSGKK